MFKAYPRPIRIALTILSVFAVSVFVILPAWFISQHFYFDESLDLASYNYPQLSLAKATCPAGPRRGVAGKTRQHTPAGFGYTVKTPANYDTSQYHPLIVVYAPAGLGARLSERYLGLTQAATQAGFIIAYADHRALTNKTVRELGRIPELITQEWCVDANRVYFTGHSDGGTVSSATAFLKETRHLPAAIAPSAAGIRGEDLSQQRCPAPLSVMVMHNANDTHFPGYGKQAADWWAQCNQCQSTPEPSAIAGCQVYRHCSEGVETLYYEGAGSHLNWPARNAEIIGFFSRARRSAHTAEQNLPRSDETTQQAE